MSQVLEGGCAVGIVCFVGIILACVEHGRVGIAMVDHFEGEEIVVYCMSYNDSLMAKIQSR
jgi:hypothetical protein